MATLFQPTLCFIFRQFWADAIATEINRYKNPQSLEHNWCGQKAVGLAFCNPSMMFEMYVEETAKVFRE